MTRLAAVGLLALAPATTGPAEDPAPAPPTWHVWAELHGVTPALAAELRDGDPPSAPAGTTPTLRIATHEDPADAIAEVVARSFAASLPYEPAALELAAAPAPGDARWNARGARLHALRITASDETTPLPWPAEPPDGWHVAALLVARAPLFAAPAPRVPAAAQAHGEVTREQDVYVLGHVDRCDPTPRHCLRWAQIVVRDDDRFVAGYLPGFQVAPRQGWVPSPTDRPRAQLVAAGRHDDRAQWVVVVRPDDGSLHRTTISAPAPSAAWPKATLDVTGRDAIVVAGTERHALVLDAELDARPDDL